MRLEEAIRKGRATSKGSLERRRKAFRQNPATPNKLVQLFNRTFREEGYGEPPMVTEQVRGMLLGFIKLCRNNELPEEKIYETVQQVVECWGELKSLDHKTLRNKKAILGDRPSLLDFLVCRESILSNLTGAKIQRDYIEKLEENSMHIAGSIKTRRRL
jgi:hypothetical protein